MRGGLKLWWLYEALQVLKAWYENGYRLRYIITEALLRLDEPHVASREEVTLGDVTRSLIGSAGYSSDSEIVSL